MKKKKVELEIYSNITQQKTKNKGDNIFNNNIINSIKDIRCYRHDVFYTIIHNHNII